MIDFGVGVVVALVAYFVGYLMAAWQGHKHWLARVDLVLLVARREGRIDNVTHDVLVHRLKKDPFAGTPQEWVD